MIRFCAYSDSLMISNMLYLLLRAQKFKERYLMSRPRQVEILRGDFSARRESDDFPSRPAFSNNRFTVPIETSHFLK